MKPNDAIRKGGPTVVVSGAIVLDLLGYYPDDFDQYDWHSVPQSLAFDAKPSLTYLVESTGGCASNIAYNLALLGAHALLVSAVGGDFSPTHFANLERVGVDLSGIKILGAEIASPRAVTLTDRSSRQFTFWASNGVGQENSPALDPYCSQAAPELVIVASNLQAIMLDHLRAASSYATKVVWAPGIDISCLAPEELRAAWTMSDYIVINEAEWQWARAIFGDKEPEWSQRLQAVVVTCGARGSIIHQDKQPPINVPAVVSENIVDPTGCGDAFVAGFSVGLISKYDLRTCVQIGSSVAVYNLESRESQRHQPTFDQVKERLCRAYGNEATANF